MNKHNPQHPTDRADKADHANKADMVDKVAAARPPRQPFTSDNFIASKGKSKWSQQVKAAKNQWGKLSEAELLKSDGDPQQLAGLVQQRYAIEHHVAQKQVKIFLDKCNIA